MTTVTAPWWLWWVLGALVAIGWLAVCWVAAGWAERLAGRWHQRAWQWLRYKLWDLKIRWNYRGDHGPECEHEEDPDAWETSCPAREDGLHCDHWYDGQACCSCGDNDPAVLKLPPERTWEQMTSPQLPPVSSYTPETLKAHIESLGGTFTPVTGMSPAERKHWGKLERARNRRAGRAEMGYRAHYAAMGLEFPSGLMARVREAAP